MKKINKQRGQISRILIILIVVILVLIVVAYGVVKFVASKKPQPQTTENQPEVVEPPPPPKPVYDVTLGDIKFTLKGSQDLGNVLKSLNSYDKDLATTEKFIRVVVGAQNKGKNNIPAQSWDIGNIVDSEGRNFVSINDKVYQWLPKPDLCGTLLKPEFSPTPCVKYYEVSRASTNLKVVVKITNPKKEESFIDLILPQ